MFSKQKRNKKSLFSTEKKIKQTFCCEKIFINFFDTFECPNIVKSVLLFCSREYSCNLDIIEENIFRTEYTFFINNSIFKVRPLIARGIGQS